ncbi:MULTISPECIES: metallophosphoesterase [unclassified Lentimicrobium]|uniref:metallophosphoesterase family protein n=1 Tax=unclassified Lentimicrobium TaxID=2677434 RepID=UPI0015579802|nr:MULTISPECIES: metallophosphoesterase [unclassified Lentimicrobium]NPD44841.1 hypothetical protein [Lentimicrobium sp. S6]NPD83142.1 hypothetical protein [Lentimicrobium sp. L6]
MRNIFFYVLITLALGSCVKYSPYETKVPYEEKYSNHKNLIQVLDLPPKDTICFLLTGDVQRFYDETLDMVEHAKQDQEIDFMVFTGDMTDFGVLQEYEAMKTIFDRLPFPYLCSVGNHDFNYNGGQIYLDMFGSFDYSFMLQGFNFVFINTNGREFIWASNVPNITWLEEQLKDTANYNGAIIINHVPPDNVDFNEGLSDAFVDAIHYPGKTMMQLNGHNHDFANSFPYYGDIQYINTSSPQKRLYLKIKIWKTANNRADYSMEKVEF